MCKNVLFVLILLVVSLPALAQSDDCDDSIWWPHDPHGENPWGCSVARSGVPLWNFSPSHCETGDIAGDPWKWGAVRNEAIGSVLGCNEYGESAPCAVSHVYCRGGGEAIVSIPAGSGTTGASCERATVQVAGVWKAQAKCTYTSTAPGGGYHTVTQTCP